MKIIIIILNRLASFMDYLLLKLSNLFAVVERSQSHGNVRQSESAAPATLTGQRPQSAKIQETPFSIRQ